MTDETAYGHREIANLLPWYENGRLSLVDRQRVEAALATDPALRQELALVREEMAATIAVNTALGAPSQKSVDRFFAALDDRQPRALGRVGLMRFIIDRVEALRPQTLAWGAVAACGLVLIQAGVIVHLAGGRPAGGGAGAIYDTASVQTETVVTGSVLLVTFEPNANAAAIRKLLEDNSLSVVSGPTVGYFSLRLESREATRVDEVIARLGARKDVVTSVTLQSPPD